ncbi:MAG TPA: regulatory iron-sulfur-containing complex subunit RicT [Smithella sp.]|nr:regulatory iron-sulfur-containing complex subunit RicT [Smithella sp.]HOU50780.1 regulatory iron-sulfur-containing complex subunit RicT [Smithella sp.]
MLVNIIGVKFKKEGKIYHFNSSDLILHKNDQVIVDTDNGIALGVVVTDVKRCPPEDVPANMKKIIRKVTQEDLQIKEDNERLEREAWSFCQEKIHKRELAMKLVDVDCLFEKSKIIFYFTAENRVDFRELVKDLVQKFKMRIELKQIGARQETRITKGIAVCGRMVCCAGILQNLERVTVKMAKEQNMSLNPEKISGLCGRLMCCLAFEHQGYAGKKKCPKITKAPGGESLEREEKKTLDLEKMDEIESYND